MYLAFPNEAIAKSILYRTEGAIEANEELGIEAFEGYEVPNFVNIDIIGTIYKNDEAIPGWHVNVLILDNEDSSVLQEYEVNPKAPTRIWG